MNSQNKTKRIIDAVLTATLLAVAFYTPQGFSSETIANGQCGANTGLPCRLQGGGTRMVLPDPEFRL
ncbi:MAG: hypothetical protein HC796_02780 [Synechococcaceae cyanobacterium RL_1_2]|nr:hypothetical protein [Synechococcaceae cyanobacterium RL_1_2]